jgi:cAMP-dependent protein kinase regulator
VHSRGGVRRTGVSAESQSSKQQEGPQTFREIPKSDIDASRIMRALKGSILFSSLDDRTMKTVVAAMEGKTYVAQQTIIRQGDDGDEFYVLDVGTCLCYLNQPDGSSRMVKEYHGDSKDNFFGELALMYNCPRAATIIASTPVHVWAMDRHTFQGVLMATTQQKRQRYDRFLTRVPLLANVDRYERQMIADALVDRSYSGTYLNNHFI